MTVYITAEERLALAAEIAATTGLADTLARALADEWLITLAAYSEVWDIDASQHYAVTLTPPPDDSK